MFALARETGALGVLPIALNQRAGLHVCEGDFAAAAALLEEAGPITEATGSGLPLYTSLALAAYGGREHELSELIDASTKETVRRGLGVGPILLDWSTAVLNNGLGRYQDALAAADRASEDTHELCVLDLGGRRVDRGGLTKRGARAGGRRPRAPL